MKKVNRKDLVEAVAEECRLSRREARKAIDVTFGLIEKCILEGKDVNVTNFGVFVPKTRQARDGTHPKNHNRIVIKEAKTVSFRLSKELKSKLN